MSEIGSYLDSLIDQVKSTAGNVANVLGDLQYNAGRNFSDVDIRIIQSVVGSPQTGMWDLETLAALTKWQGSPQRAVSLTADGRLGPGSLGCMIFELQKAGRLTDARQLAKHTYVDPFPLTGKQLVLKFELQRTYIPMLRTVRSSQKWYLHGRFKATLLLNPNIPDPSRYEYRQQIKGTAFVEGGMWPANIPVASRTLLNWQPRADRPKKDAKDAFLVPGGLPPAWQEDGILVNGIARKFGYRDQPPAHTESEEDRYVPYKDGYTYFLTDTYGLEGKVLDGTKVGYMIFWKGMIIDRQNNDKVVWEQEWDEQVEDVVNLANSVP